ncbi:hypothetical protein HYW17_01735 [Candidatus Uhrbacteria bacterium]|nr:hypothetical protein [Candidatus Uhrbacteria bacterium]
MNLETLKKAGIRFDYCRDGVFPQIPYTQDVLYVLQLSDEKDAQGYYGPEGARNWSTYIENVLLAAAAVASRVLNMERYDEAAARKIIAEAIMELCPPEAKCLFNSAFVAAQEIFFMGEPALSRTADRETLLRACDCQKCRSILHERRLAEHMYT